ncbi:MAG: glycosyltransferase [Acidobacteriota bacterium]|nr:glycosyltransferase [Acidobacteriota bacterium]
MRILHVAASYLPAVRYGGTIVSVHGLCRALAARGHDVHVFTTSVDGAVDSDVPLLRPVELDGVQVWYFPSKVLRRLYWSPRMAGALAGQIGTFDIAHLHALFVWPVWAAAKAARRAGVPYVVAPRGMLEKALIKKKSRVTKTLLIAAVGRRTLEQAAAIHVTSARERAEAAAFGFALPPLYEVPNGVDLVPTPVASVGLSPAVAALCEGPPFLLFIGRISWKKGLDRLIAALPHVPGVRLVIAGPDEEGYRTTLEARAAAAGVGGRLVFCGPVPGAGKAALLNCAQALVLPSYSENFGNVVLEAMAAACPVVVTPEVGIADLVRDSGAGWVIDGAPKTLGAGLSALVADSQLRRTMGERGRATAQHYGWAAVAERMERVYQEIVA